MKYLDLFSGIGGFTLGIQQAYESYNHRHQANGKGKNTSDLLGRDLSDPKRLNVENPLPRCVGFSEIDKYAAQIYQKHFPEHKAYGNITKINERELPDFDLLVGGFPCQSFSIAGKRGGFSDTRGTLFFEIARILKHKQPRLLLLENVKGLLSHDEGRTFATIIATLDELGYDLQWQVLNSKNFGVPQNRERVFIIGHLRGTPRPQVFPITADSQADIVLPTLTSRYFGAQANGGYIRNKPTQVNNPRHSNDRVYADNGHEPMIQQRSHGFFKGSESDIAPSIRGASVAHNVYVDKIRRLTPLECERLQSFPDGWTKYGVTDTSLAHPFLISDTQRYKCLGNAVTVNVIQAISEKII